MSTRSPAAISAWSATGTRWLNKMIADAAGEMGLLLGTTHEDPRVASILGDAEPWWEADTLRRCWPAGGAIRPTTRQKTHRLVNPNYLKIWCDVLANSIGPTCEWRLTLMAADSTPRSTPLSPAASRRPLVSEYNSVEWRSATLEQVLQNMQPYGLTLVELIARKNLPKDDRPRAKELLAKHGVRANSVSAFTKLNEVVHNGVAETQELINELLQIAAYDGRSVYPHLFWPNAFLDDNEAIKRYVEFMKPCLRKAAIDGAHAAHRQPLRQRSAGSPGDLPPALPLERRHAHRQGNRPAAARVLPSTRPGSSTTTILATSAAAPRNLTPTATRS